MFVHANLRDGLTETNTIFTNALGFASLNIQCFYRFYWFLKYKSYISLKR